MNLLAAIEASASTGTTVTVEGVREMDVARELIDDDLAVLSAGAHGQAILGGYDPEGRVYNVVLCDVYAPELTER